MSSAAKHMQLKHYVRPALIALAVLVAAGIATLTYEDFNWGVGDFIGMGLFVYLFGFIFELAMVKMTKHRRITGGLIVLLFFTLYVLMATTE